MESKLSMRLKSLRLSQNIPAKDVIKKLKGQGQEFSEPSVYKWEEGSCTPKLQTIIALSKIYHCNVSYLVEDKDVEYFNLTPTEITFLKLFRTDFLFRSLAVQIMQLLERDNVN